MRSMWIVAISLPLLTAGCAAPEPIAASPAASAPVPKQDPVGCVINGEPICELGKAPNITVMLTNQTDADIYLVGSLDASDCRWRYPHCYFEVTGPDGKPSTRGIGRCGLTNPLQAKNFWKVPPGKSFDPFGYGFSRAHQLNLENFRAPGVYRIRFVYSANCDDLKAWCGNGMHGVEANAEIVGMFRQVPKVEVRSDEFALTVVAPGT